MAPWTANWFVIFVPVANMRLPSFRMESAFLGMGRGALPQALNPARTKKLKTKDDKRRPDE